MSFIKKQLVLLAFTNKCTEDAHTRVYDSVKYSASWSPFFKHKKSLQTERYNSNITSFIKNQLGLHKQVHRERPCKGLQFI